MADRRVLTVNAGSSSLKLALIDVRDHVLAERELASADGRIDRDELGAALATRLGSADAVGHRVVHGGDRFREAAVVDEHVRRSLHELAALAPLRQEASLAAMDAVAAVLPGVPVVACFDTAFHACLPPAAATYAPPAAWRERWPLRRLASTGFRTPTSRAAPPSCSDGREPGCGS